MKTEERERVDAGGGGRSLKWARTGSGRERDGVEEECDGIDGILAH